MEERILVVAPSGKDALLIATALHRADIEAQVCATVFEAIEVASTGCGALLVADEALSDGAALRTVVEFLQSQPSWSDLPMLLLTHKGRSVLTASMVQALGNVTLVDRPTQVVALISAARAALRNRQHQYEIRDANARKDEFLAMLAHELRNPLAPISNAGYLLGSIDLQDPKAKMAVGVLQRQARQLSRLVDDLLDVARISRGKISLQKARHDLRDLVRQGVETSELQIEAMAHDLELQLPNVPVPVIADSARIAQCVTNLVTNAAKYTPCKGRIRVSLEQQGAYATLAVQDNGVGFDSSQAAYLFDLFAQAHEEHSHTQGGLGIGLAIVKSLVQMHGGTVTAHSDGPQLGSRFEFRLPLDLKSRQEESVLPSSHKTPTRPLAILVVDDNVDVAVSTSELLRYKGHEVRVAHSGIEALAILEMWSPNVALLDIGLPDVNGHDLARTITARLGSRRPTLVALSGWGQRSDVERSHGAGIAHHLTKPVDLDRLEAILQRVAP